MKAVRRLFGTIGRSSRRTSIIVLIMGLFVVLVANMFGQVRLNQWYGSFFDALERRNLPEFLDQLGIFGLIVVVLLTLVVSQTWLQEILKLRVREWITHTLLDDWLVPGRAYRLGISSELGVNPDHRVAEDTRQLAELSTSLGVGLFQSTLLLISFIGILWGLSENITLSLFGNDLTVPGYMVWCAVGYAVLGSLATWKVGFPLIRYNALRYQRESELRFALVRVSESAESVALCSGEQDERRSLNRTFDTVLASMWQLSGGLSRLTWITSGYGWLAIVVPIVAAAPGYFAGWLSMGDLMMVVGAFNQVQSSLRYFVDQFPAIADWCAALVRVAALHEALGTIDTALPDDRRLRVEQHPWGALAFDDVCIFLADGSVVVKEANVEIQHGERVLIVGESGIGKSTMFRVISGLWPWGSGRILTPPPHEMMFMPQRPYLPLGTLKAAVCYASAPDAFDDDEVAMALKRVDMEEFLPLLLKEDRWDRSLSLGQQQRIAFARMLLHRPKWVFLDEATAALDTLSQSNVMSVFDKELPDTTVISIGHRPGLEEFHDRTLHLISSPNGALLSRSTSGNTSGRRPDEAKFLLDET